MKRIDTEDIKEGDYIKAVISDKQYEENLKNKIPDNIWKVTYLKVDYIEFYKEEETKELGTDVWVDFDEKGNFMRVLRNKNTIYCNDVICYKLTEEEFARDVGKYLILNVLENGKNK
jgi:hypothetical protein